MRLLQSTQRRVASPSGPGCRLPTPDPGATLPKRTLGVGRSPEADGAGQQGAALEIEGLQGDNAPAVVQTANLIALSSRAQRPAGTHGPWPRASCSVPPLNGAIASHRRRTACRCRRQRQHTHAGRVGGNTDLHPRRRHPAAITPHSDGERG